MGKIMQNRKVRVRLAGALAIVGVLMLTFSSVAIAQGGPSEFPPPPPSPLAPPNWDEDAPLMPIAGDANLSGAVTAADASDILLHAMTPEGWPGRLSAEGLKAADTYGRGHVTAANASHILQYAMDPTGALGVLTEPLWDWEREIQRSLRDPRRQNWG